MRWLAAVLGVAAWLGAGAAQAQTPPQQQGGSTAILMQGFHWNSWSYSNPDWYAILKSQAADMHALGITHVWFPPPSDSLDDQGYLPRKLNDLSHDYGSQSELQAAVKAFARLGIKSVIDTVINHRVGTSNAYNFTDPKWTTAAITSNDECDCGAGAADTGLGYASARDLDHTNSQVSTGIPVWMATLKKIGFSGIRYDYALGYRGALQANYSAAFAPDFCVDEIWTTLNLSAINAHRAIEIGYITGDGSPCAGSNDASCGTGNGGTCGTFDFTTHGLLVEALTNNDYNVLQDVNGTDPAGAIGLDPAMEVTFVDNHDTGPAETCSSGQNLWPVPCGAVMQGYAYILTHPGIPTVFYPHVYNWNLRAPIAALVAARKAAGVNSTSPVAIQQATTGLYAAIVTGTVAQLAIKIGPNSWQPSGAGWVLQTSGNDYAVWMN